MAQSVRVAIFNTALSRDAAGAFVQEMRLGGTPQSRAVVEIIRLIDPDILLLCEIDHDPRAESVRLLTAALSAAGTDYPHAFTAPVNTGVLAPVDLDGDGERTLPGDAFGFGRHPGHFGMAILSRFPVTGARTFQLLPWRNMPGHRMPRGYYAPEAEAVLRLSSKSHWDVVVDVEGRQLHLLVSHPTPPVFDGPEDRNGRRNADEIRFWADYLDGRDWIVDDSGHSGGLGDGLFVLLGDLNADPADGDGRREAIRALLGHPRLADPMPRSAGAAAAPRPPGRVGDAALATAAFPLPAGPLRVDYVLPDRRLEVLDAGVFWPADGEPFRNLVGDGRRIVSSDHRLVWVDVTLPATP